MSRQLNHQVAPTSLSAFPGQPFPLGATVTDTGTNFSVVADGSPSAAGAGESGVVLCLVDAAGEERRWEMRDFTHGAWHAFVPGVGAGQRYGYRVAAHDPGKLLLDPYARRVDSTEYDLMAASGAGIDTLGAAPLGVVAARSAPVPEGPRVPWEHTVIYEAHVTGLTATHPAVPDELRGTFAGVAHPAVIEHLKQLHVTTLELLPVQAFASEPGLVATGRTNYWGYSTLSYFAPHPGYARGRGREVEEFADMVRTLHEAGIELVLDVVYNHTCEGGPSAPITLSWRGLSPAGYYLPEWIDLTGTGNTVNVAPLATIRMITDSLRYWAGELGVDGFRFDLASVLGRPHGGPFDAGSALLTAIAADPLLSGRKLIAEPWDATGEGYAVGGFGLDWAEWNDRFRDDVRDFWRGAGRISDLAYRLTGSQDRFGDGRRPWASVNFVTAHDGFTLRDLVSYNDKHNLDNGENNADGTADNRSDNNGVEGDTDDPAILSRRLRQARNMAATMLLSTGTPMLSMGDELWRTQGGNNNAYCQDNPISWIDWEPMSSGEPGPATDLLAFYRRTLDIRLGAVALHQGEFFSGRPTDVGADDPAAVAVSAPDLAWFNASGGRMSEADWADPHCRTVQMWVNGTDVAGHGPHGELLTDDSWLLVLHAGVDPVEVALPDGEFGVAYLPMLDTGTADGTPPDSSPLSADLELTVPGRTVLLLRAVRPGG
ncbi:glycogen debranching protein GlgX [Nakamurella lactea]|uniref:glycogen debranching protein GlgX n=1 Tax=Nakamurella lactea TaxID=459515 RepID=UPI00048B386C|nr:glycogen debranching protein GlgX [Nakamurella lactea]